MPEVPVRRVLVTGASSRIGGATALMLAGADAQVLATGCTAERLDALAKHRIGTLAADLLEPGFITELAVRAGDCDVLVANAGRLKQAPFLRSRLLATLALVRGIAERAVRRDARHLVLVSSLLARRVSRNRPLYAAAKHALARIAARLRLKLGPSGIPVTEVAADIVRAGVFRDIDHQGVRDACAAMDFHFRQPDDVAAAILGAVAARPGVCADLIQLRPIGQP